MILRELIAKIGFQVDTKQLDKFDKTIGGLKEKIDSVGNSLKIVTAAAVAAGGGIFALSAHTADAIRKTEQLSKQLGISANDLMVLDETAKAAGFSTDQLTNSLLRFDTMLGQAKISAKGTSNEFKALGINIHDSSGQTKDSVSLFAETSRKLLLLKDPAKQAAISYRLFGTTNVEMARFMGQANDQLLLQIKSIRDLSFEIDSNAIDSSKKFSRSWSETKTVFKSVKNEIALQFMPVFNELLDDFKSWFVLNKDLIKQNIASTVSGISKAISALSQVISFVLKPFTALIKMVGGFENAVTLTASVLGVLFIPRLLAAVNAVKLFSLALLANPVVFITKAVVALGVAISALVVEDIAAWVTGNESAIGRVLGAWVDFKVFLKGIWSDISSGVIDSLNTIGDLGQKVFDGITDSIMSVVNSILSTRDKIRSALTPNIFKDRNNDVETTVTNNVITKRLNQPIKPLPQTSIEEKSVNLDSKKMGVVQRKSDSINGLTVEHAEAGSRFNRSDSSVPRASIPTVSASTSYTPSLLPIENNITKPGNNRYNSTNNISQNITENITINVPPGTTDEQSRSISSQVASEVNRQLQTSIIEGLDSISMR